MDTTRQLDRAFDCEVGTTHRVPSRGLPTWTTSSGRRSTTSTDSTSDDATARSAWSRLQSSRWAHCRQTNPVEMAGSPTNGSLRNPRASRRDRRGTAFLRRPPRTPKNSVKDGEPTCRRGSGGHYAVTCTRTGDTAIQCLRGSVPELRWCAGHEGLERDHGAVCFPSEQGERTGRESRGVRGDRFRLVNAGLPTPGVATRRSPRNAGVGGRLGYMSDRAARAQSLAVDGLAWLLAEG